MRIDKYLTDTGRMTRSEAGEAIKAGRVRVNGETLKDRSRHIEERAALVTLDGEAVVWRRFTYVMLNKPAGYISSTEDSSATVMKLLPAEFTKMGMFPAGRLDIDTTGLLLITNDGALAHELLSPKHHVQKVYRFTCSPAIGEKELNKLCAGVDIGSGHVSAPATLLPDGEACNGIVSGEICVTEGKFHQIKRMFESVGSSITSLERISFASLMLDISLGRGEWRYLTDEETEILKGMGKANA